MKANTTKRLFARRLQKRKLPGAAVCEAMTEASTAKGRLCARRLQKRKLPQATVCRTTAKRQESGCC